MRAKLLKRKRDSGTGYTVSMYRTETGFRVTLSDATDPSHKERREFTERAAAVKAASDLWDTARDCFDTEPW